MQLFAGGQTMPIDNDEDHTSKTSIEEVRFWNDNHGKDMGLAVDSIYAIEEDD
jgi:hypothetical protein